MTATTTSDPRTAHTSDAGSTAGPLHPSAPPTAPSTAHTAGTALGLLVLRVAIGFTFIAHGWQKVAVNGLAGTTEGFGGMGVPAPELLAPFVAFTEIIAGALLIVGLLTRVAALALAVTALVALFLVHASSGFYAADGGIELVFLLAAGALALVATGAGRLSLDAPLWSRIRSRRTV